MYNVIGGGYKIVACDARDKEGRLMVQEDQPRQLKVTLPPNSSLRAFGLGRSASDDVSQVYQELSRHFALLASRITQHSMNTAKGVCFAADEIKLLANEAILGSLEVNQGIFDKMRESTQRIAELSRFLRCCSETDWPIFWDCSEDFEGEIAEIARRFEESGEDSAVLRSAVTEAVLGYYDERRVRDFLDRWSEGNLVNEGQLSILSDAIERHIAGDYLASTSLLMCLLEGFAEEFYQCALSAGLLSDEDFVLLSEAYNVRKPTRKRSTARAQIYSLSLCTEGGVLYWDAACEYIAEITLTSTASWEELAKDNPLRNKICHGDQTNFGTRVHSLKAILVVDLILCLGAFVEVAAEGDDQ